MQDDTLLLISLWSGRYNMNYDDTLFSNRKSCYIKINQLKIKLGWYFITNLHEVIGSGAMKDVYFSPDKSYVVCF